MVATTVMEPVIYPDFQVELSRDAASFDSADGWIMRGRARRNWSDAECRLLLQRAPDRDCLKDWIILQQVLIHIPYGCFPK